MKLFPLALSLCGLCVLHAQETPAPFVIEPGNKIPLSLLNTLSSKQTAEGDRVYLETIFPVMANGRIVIPPGSY